MSNSPTEKASTVANQMAAKTRKPYHTPRLDTYGEVSTLTRSGTLAPIISDGIGTYTSQI